MKNYNKPLFIVFTMMVLIITPNLHASAMEMIDSKMMDHKLTSTNVPITIPLTKGYVKGSEVFYISTEASDKELAAHLTEITGFRVAYTPALKLTPADSLAQIYAFENGIEGMGPLGFQPNVADSQPGDINYSPLWAVNIVKWNDGTTPRELKSQTEILSAQKNNELTVTPSGFVVNCPFILWDGGSIQVRENKSLDDETPYGGGQVLDIDLEKMLVTFVAHRGFGPDGSTIYYIATDASVKDVADMLGVVFVERTGTTLLSGASSDLYVFTNGITGSGPMGFQASIGSTNVGDEFYSPMWRIQAATWSEPDSADFLTTTEQITSAASKGALSTEVAGVVVNCPFVEIDESMMDDKMKPMDDSMKDHMASPLKQLAMGMDAQDVKCKNELVIIFKATNGMPACVKPSSVDRLVEIGWASKVMKGMMETSAANVPAIIPMHKGWYDGEPVYFIITDSSEQKHADIITAKQDWKVELAPLLANAPEAALSKAYIFTNGVGGEGIHGFQGEIFTSTPEQPEIYSALTSHIHVTWNADQSPELLNSEDAVLQAEQEGKVTLTKLPVVINMPQIVWPGGQMMVKEDKTLTEDTPYGGGQVLDIDTEKMTVTFVAHKGWGPDGDTIYYIVTDATPEMPAEMMGVVSSPTSANLIANSAAADLFQFGNGITGTGPMGFQAGIGSSAPGDENYSPMWRIHMVSWKDPSSAVVLERIDDINGYQKDGAVDVSLARPMDKDHIVNCPFIDPFQ